MKAFDPREFDARLRVEQLEARYLYDPLSLTTAVPTELENGTTSDQLLDRMPALSDLNEEVEQYGLY
jgi:hypothetical protein